MPRFSTVQIALTLAVGSAALLMLGLQPILLGELAERQVITLEGLGMVATVEIFALGVGVVYVVVRLAAIGRRRSLLVGLAVLGLVGAGVAVSPLRDIIHTRTTSGQNSNHTRSTLYQEAFAGVAASPLFGNGSPQVSSQTLGGSRVGTQGQFALVLFSHGIPGILFYLGWFAFTAAHALRRRSIDELLWNAAIIVSFVEMAVYDFLPVTLYVLMIACALLWRARQPSAQTTPAVAAAAAYPARSVLA